MAGTVNAKTNPATEGKVPLKLPEKKSYSRSNGTNKSGKRTRSKTHSRSANSSSNSTRKANGKSRAKNAQSKPKKPRKWECTSCGCRNSTRSNTCKSCKGKLPQISLFKASRRAIRFGDPIRLSWEVDRADKVYINPGKELVENVGVLDVDPLETTEYVLTAVNEYGSKSLSTKVRLSSPKIQEFSASETEITVGFATILHWKATNAESLEINMNIGDVSGKEFTEAYLTKPGTCTLIAKNRSGQAKASIRLSLKQPEILSFTADTQTIRLGKPNLLMWEIHNTEFVEVLPDIGLIHDNKVEVSPDRNCTYTLRAFNHTGQVEKTIELVLPPPKVVHFAGSNELSVEGAPVTLNWDIENAYHVFIDQGIGEVSPIGSCVVKPSDAFTTYTLYATGHSGETKKSFGITRFPIPLNETLVQNGLEIESDPDLRQNDLPMQLNEFENMEKELRKNLKNQSRNVHIKRVQNMDLTDDLLTLKKATLRKEFSELFKALKKKLNKKSNT